ncbi:MAG: 16S rRNA (cytosine(1402)-N(4))-methyltransferase RsmH [Patescibacteria group bacterium]
MIHISVLLQETISALDLENGEIFLDATIGGGGHSREVLRRFPKVKIVGLDRDRDAVLHAQELGIETRQESFRNLDQVLKKLSVGEVDAILFDLGISSDQLEHSGKGFSFLRDEPLDMRMSAEGIMAKDLLNSWDESALEVVLRGFGEEKFSKKIAREIVLRRQRKPFETTFDLVDTVLKVRPRTFRDKIHPATKTFQALRIAVNDELTALEHGLEKGFRVLKEEGRFVVISFHSGEDRIVKNFFRDRIKEGSARRVGKRIKPITASKEEMERNPRSRSAKLRVIEKI